MCLADDDPNKNAASDAEATGAFFDKSALQVLPGIDELLADPEISRRVGKIIADAARRANAKS